jgi:hypothetical protein
VIAPELPGPLTHAGYVAICTRVAIEHQQVPDVRVQIRRRGEVICAKVLQVLDLHEAEWYAVETPIDARVWVKASHVRQCSHLDGRCTCSPAESSS